MKEIFLIKDLYFLGVNVKGVPLGWRQYLVLSEAQFDLVARGLRYINRQVLSGVLLRKLIYSN